jgi:hypothetical protein
MIAGFGSKRSFDIVRLGERRVRRGAESDSCKVPIIFAADDFDVAMNDGLSVGVGEESIRQINRRSAKNEM